MNDLVMKDFDDIESEIGEVINNGKVNSKVNCQEARTFMPASLCKMMNAIRAGCPLHRCIPN